MDKEINFLLEHFSHLMSHDEIENLRYLSYELILEDGHANTEDMKTLNDVLKRFNCQFNHLPKLDIKPFKGENMCELCDLPVFSVYYNLRTNKSGHKSCVRN